jgi:hypothetical protein
MGVKVDLSQSRGLPLGTYRFRITDAEVKESQKGGQYINWKLAVVDGEHADSEMSYMTTLQPHALFGFKALMRAIGYDIPAEADELDFDPRDALGNEFIGELKEDTYNGDTRNVVGKVYHVDEIEALKEKAEAKERRRR